MRITHVQSIQFPCNICKDGGAYRKESEDIIQRNKTDFKHRRYAYKIYNRTGENEECIYRR